MARCPGLTWDPATGRGRVRKIIRGESVSKRFEAGTRDQAEALYYQIIAAPKPAAGLPTFLAAATHYLTTEANKKSIERDAYALERLMPHLGHLPLNQIHQGTLAGFIEHRRQQGISSGTVRREIAVVRRILTLASRYWRDAQGQPWLITQPPLFRLPDWKDRAKPYPLSWDEEQRLLGALPEHLAHMTAFGLQTGARESVIAGLRWEWLRQIDEIGRRVFIVPGEHTKNGTDCLIPLNHRAEAIIQTVQGQHPTHVFTWITPAGTREPVSRIHNSGWKHAWRKAGLPTDKGIHKGPHNLRHTFARRLRAAMIPHETIKALLHHIDGDITLNYAPAQLEDLFRAVDSILIKKTLLRAVR